MVTKVSDLCIFNESQTLVLETTEDLYSVYLLDLIKGELGKEDFKFPHKAKMAFDLRKNCSRPDYTSVAIEEILTHPYDPKQYYLGFKKGT